MLAHGEQSETAAAKKRPAAADGADGAEAAEGAMTHERIGATRQARHTKRKNQEVSLAHIRGSATGHSTQVDFKFYTSVHTQVNGM